MKVAALILAAGRATRFGQDKRQALLPDGRGLLDTTLAVYAQVYAPVLLVLRPGEDWAQDLAAQHGAHVVICASADQGMGHSLAAGAQAVLALPPQVGAAVIALADMPAVSASTLRSIEHALLQHGRAVVPVHAGRAGHPRGLPRAGFAALTTLRGDVGARQVLDWSEAMPCPVNDPGVLLDIDHPDDLARLQV